MAGKIRSPHLPATLARLWQNGTQWRLRARQNAFSGWRNHRMTEGFDTSRPNIARVYNYWLGGKDHYEADRVQAEQLLRIYPGIADAVRSNRQFVGRAVTWAAQEGIGQFIDLGAGLPAAPSVHETARAVLPGAHVAYVDNDPVVIAHASALLATDDSVAAIPGDLRDPGAVLASEDLTAVIDLRRPACVILALVLHFSDAATAREITAGYISALAPGSCVVLSVGGNDDPGGRAAATYTAGTLHTHSREEVAGFLDGLDLVEPGLSDARAWRPGWGETLKPNPQAGYVLAAVGRKTADLKPVRDALAEAGGRDAFCEPALDEQERDDHRRDRQHRSRHDQAILDDMLAQEQREAGRQRVHVAVGADDERPQQVIPVVHEVEQPEGEHGRHRQAQDDAAVDLELGGAIDPGRVL
jgi:hypothetical protein